MPVRASDVTAHRLPDWVEKKPDAQRASYIALRRKGWDVSKSLIAGFQAHKHERGETVYAMDFVKLHLKASKKDAAAQAARAKK